MKKIRPITETVCSTGLILGPFASQLGMLTAVPAANYKVREQRK